MSGVGAPVLASLFWIMLIAGAGLAGSGLCLSLLRYRDWKAAGRFDEGDLVFGDGELRAGQSAWIAPGERAAATDSPGVISGHISALTRKHCVLSQETDFEQIDDRAKREWPRIGETVTVSVTGKTALYRFAARVHDIRVNSGKGRGAGRSLILSRPAWLARLQRRQHARVDLKMPVTFERVWSPGSSNMSPTPASPLRTSAPMHGSVHNLSGGGVRAQIGGVLRLHELDDLLKLFAPETTVRLRLPLSTLPESALLARVRTCERAASRGGLTLQVSCEFLPMPVWEQELVISQVFRLQRELLKRGEIEGYDGQPGVYQ